MLKFLMVLILFGFVNTPTLQGQTIYINGVVNNYPLTTIEIRTTTNTSFFTKTKILCLDTLNKKNEFHFKCKVSKPCFVSIANFRIFIKPGDNINLQLLGNGNSRSDSIIAIGKNAINFTFITQFSNSFFKKIQKIYPPQMYDSSPDEDDKDLDKVIAEELMDLKKKFRSHAIPSQIYKWGKEYIIYKYIETYIALRGSVGKHPKDFSKPPSNVFFQPLQIKSFAINHPVDSMGYMNACYQIAEHNTNLTFNYTLPQYSGGDFLKNFYQFVVHNYSGNILDYLLNRMVWDYSMNKKKTDTLYDSTLKTVYSEIKQITKEPLILDSLYKKTFINNSVFTKEVLNSIFYDVEGKKNEFGDILKKHKGKFVFIDFWATWCGPCKDEMPYLKKIENEFNTNDIVFICVSVDSEIAQKQWIDAAQEIGNINYHYMASKGFDSEIVNYLNISGIPQYILIDKSGRLIGFTPRPSDKSLESYLQKILANKN